MSKRKELGAQVFDVVRERRAERERRVLAARRARKSALLRIESAWREARPALEHESFADYEQLSTALTRIELDMRKLRRALNDTHMEQLRAAATQTFGLETRASALDQSGVVVREPSAAWRASIVYADPPWAYSNPAHVVGTKQQYDTMSDDALAALPVAGLANEDSVLLMWATFPKLEAALRIMNAWGFDYRTVFTVWIKIERYMARLQTSYGAYTRPNAEFVLIGVRGNMRTTLHNKSFRRPNVLLSRPHEHSRKPALLRQIAVELFGDLPRIELFGREATVDWRVWGNQVADDGDGAAVTAHSAPESARHSAQPKKRRNNLRVGALRNRKSASRRTSRHKPRATLNYLDRFDYHNTLDKVDVVRYSEHKPAGAGARDEAAFEAPELPVAECARMQQFWTEDKSRRHPVYTSLSCAEVADKRNLIRAAQQRNADLLFAYNYNRKKQKLVQCSVALPNDE